MKNRADRGVCVERLVMPDFDYTALRLGSMVRTPYGDGTVVEKRGERFIEFDDGSGCSCHEAIALTSATSDKSSDAVITGRTQAVAQIAPLVKEFRERAKSIMDNPFIGNRVADAWDEAADQLERAIYSIEEMT